jgi:hypothetical protein
MGNEYSRINDIHEVRTEQWINVAIGRLHDGII